VASKHYDVRDRVVLITGAARGIGWESARRLAAKGARLALVGLEPELLEQRAAELGGGDRAAAFHADVTDRLALQAAVDAAAQHFGGIDVVVANAGIAAVGTVATIDEDAFERVVEVNLLGVWRTVRAALPYVLERNGYILPIASLAAAMHAPLMASYAAAKAGVEAFADVLRQEVAHTGTRVGCAYFGFIDTDMVRDSYSHPATGRIQEDLPSFIWKPIPLSRAGDAIVRGVEQRSEIVYAPRWVGAVLALRGIVGPLAGRRTRRDPNTAAAVQEADSVATLVTGPQSGMPERAQAADVPAAS
jgi:NAD(P)-dependent dehydrogenase (short-subunit alcohol dehydrogenase family)